ncbi:hypothetical protein LAG90_06920 [Marinilongibacter aquaticus]|uniref:SulP family inorganic anion transporter n=1 Tax=Marinilongibacter aquaticus TaxID=2975157 RepID=UPI0021BDB180|nr:SulP family inorganic anion transporter [Marinilongibacter aquaticus]UBM60376.1 hypothetical protein LAG90_06920 [Marinilongibacter aquaticus]
MIEKITKNLANNLFAGFVVSVVAMPLGLSLAIASGVPAIAGVITSIVGGIVVSLFGGGYVSISGAAYGLVVVVLAAVNRMGDGDPYEGYLYTLAAIIISGLIILLLSFVNLGKLANFFPSSAIQGMLAAIGIILISKQIHILLGSLHVKGNTIELLKAIPHSFLEFVRNPEQRPAGWVGILSLLIMFFYSNIRNKYFQLAPAPMWIVLLSVLMANIFANSSMFDNPISSEYFVQISKDALTALPSPKFGKMLEPQFILLVFTITILASIESLLAIKAVDKLDPQNRKSNINKDLRALGLATIVSGFLGGLNVVTKISVSSVNVNNKATNRSSNFFHAVFLIILIWVFHDEFQKITYPALAAILVYTGYKLAKPKLISEIREIGGEQLIIFVVTVVATLFTDLIVGILIGIFTTFLVHMYLTKSPLLFFRNMGRNNVELTLERDGKKRATVKYFASFVNFFRLKRVLDEIEPTDRVVVDFLQCGFVDHTVMENLWDYEQVFDKNGGEFEVIGLDLHSAESAHPFALRRALKYVPFVNTADTQTRRQEELGKFMNSLAWNFSTEHDYHMFFLRDFSYFKTRQVDHLYNIGQDKKKIFKLFDIEYSEGAFILEEQLHATMLYISTRKRVPAFTLDKGDLFERMQYLSDYKEIKLRSFRDFAKRFTLRGGKILGIRRFFTDEMILFFESNNYYHIESNGKGGILIMDKERHSGVGEIKAMVDFGIRLEELINKKV